MGKNVEITMIERSSDLSESDTETDAIENGRRELGIHEALLIADHQPEASVGRWYLLFLTCGVGGLQVVWSVILSNGSPFLVSLGLSKSLTALVWVAAPLCGVIVQPLVGILSDRTRSRWGRRRPFIMGGAIGVIIAMLALAWVEEIFHGASKAVSKDLAEVTARTSVMLIAIFWIYALNICIQPLQAGLRALIIENCPVHQQTQASAWASGMTGVGNIVGYLAGFASLPSLVSKHLTQFQCLCLIASLSLLVTVAMSCSIKEMNSPYAFPVRLERTGCTIILRDLVHTYKSMPKRIRKVCHIQIFAWMGWFPFLFYSTTYVGEFYTGRVVARDLPISEPSFRGTLFPRSISEVSNGTKALCLDAIRYGTFASFLFATTAFLTNISLPLFLRQSTKPAHSSPRTSSAQPIPQAWTLAHLFFALAMFSTFFATSQATATLIIASAGLSWALTLWAPFAIIGNELALRKARQDAVDGLDVADVISKSEDEVQAGAIMGLHNVAISAPQIVAALACSGIFGLAKVTGSHYGTGWVLRAGGVAALGAAYLTYRFEE